MTMPVDRPRAGLYREGRDEACHSDADPPDADPRQTVACA